jgi:hypothetical protein
MGSPRGWGGSLTSVFGKTWRKIFLFIKLNEIKALKIIVEMKLYIIEP